MKAVKIYKIQWNLENLPEEELNKVIDVLPTKKGFTTDDSFDVVERVPGLLKRKYGYDIIDFAFTEIPIADTLEGLLLICKPTDVKEKAVFNVINGKITNYGQMCLANLERNIKWRLKLESEGTDEWSMPAILDAVMIGIEKVTGLQWGGHTVEELMDPIKKQIPGLSKSKKKEDELEDDGDSEMMEEE